jgi:DNA polymerase-1
LADQGTTRADSLLQHVREDRRIHSTFDPLGTVTGRFTSKEPSLHNVSKGDLRTAFRAPEARCLVRADYSQIELRVAAAEAGDENMIEAFNLGKDQHSSTAASIFNKPLQDVTPEERQAGKAMNFGIIFGQGLQGLVDTGMKIFEVRITQPAQKRQAFYRDYPGIKKWDDDCLHDADNGLGESRTRTGRRRLIPTDVKRDKRHRVLLNTPIQGGAADGLKEAMVLVHERLPEGAILVLNVHDELIVECATEDAEQIREILVRSMVEGMHKIYPEVKIEVNAPISHSWAGD